MVKFVYTFIQLLARLLLDPILYWCSQRRHPQLPQLQEASGCLPSHVDWWCWIFKTHATYNSFNSVGTDVLFIFYFIIHHPDYHVHFVSSAKILFTYYMVVVIGVVILLRVIVYILFKILLSSELDLHLLVLTGFEFCLYPAYSYTIFKLPVRHLIFDF